MQYYYKSYTLLSFRERYPLNLCSCMSFSGTKIYVILFVVARLWLLVSTVFVTKNAGWLVRNFRQF
jgi:hypothetical protein